MNIPLKISETFKVVSFIGTLLIITIHYNNKHNYTIEGSPFHFCTLEYIGNCIARVAVPLFALMSGFFFYQNIDEQRWYSHNLKKRIKSLLTPYLLASLVIYLSYQTGQVLIKNEPPNLNFLTVIKNIILVPVSEQFWYIRDLIILCIISPCLIYKNKTLQGLLGTCLIFLWLSETQIFPLCFKWHLIHIETLFFFWLGGRLSQSPQLLVGALNLKTKYLCILLFSSQIFFISRIIIQPDLNLWYSAHVPLLPLILQKVAILCSIPLVFNLASRLRNKMILYIAQFNFFVFLFHFIPLKSLLDQMSLRLNQPNIPYFISFWVVPLISFSTAIALSKITPKLYKLLSGSRNPQISYSSQ